MVLQNEFLEKVFSLNNKVVIVTGAAGQIGSSLVSTLIKLDLPAPLGPTIAVICPAPMLVLMLRRTLNPDINNERLSTLNAIRYNSLRC